MNNPIKKTNPGGIRPVQNAPKVTITPKAKKGAIVKKRDGGNLDTSKLGKSDNKGRGMVPTSMPSATKPMAKRGGMVKKTMRKR